MLLEGIIARHGIPLGVYTDRYSVFQSPDQRRKIGSGSRAIVPTQWGRALRELGVTQIFAHSPEAKGRVERANGTFQDRLVSELRLAGASTLAEANDVLNDFLPRFDARFAVPASQAGSAYRMPDPGLEIGGVLCHKEQRRVAKDNTVQYHGRTLQLFPDADRSSYAGARVEVQELLDGRLLVSYRGTVLTPQGLLPLLLPYGLRPTRYHRSYPKNRNRVRRGNQNLLHLLWTGDRPMCSGMRTPTSGAAIESWSRQEWSGHERWASGSDAHR